MKYYVLNDNTLVYVISQHSLGVLASRISPLTGEGHDWINGPIGRPSDDRGMRVATREDFEAFRVESCGYFNETT